jgi:predicted DNA-binding transcriptional regulator AlpA
MIKTNHSTVNINGAEVLDDKQVSALLNTNARTLRLWRATRGLPFIRITSKVIRYRRADIDQWLERRRVAIAA